MEIVTFMDGTFGVTNLGGALVAWDLTKQEAEIILADWMEVL